MPFDHVAHWFVLPVAIAMLTACSPSHPVTDAKPVSSANVAQVFPVHTTASSAVGVSTSAVAAVDALPRMPVPSSNLTPDHVVQVVGADNRACAIFDNGMLQCWGGFNFDGELGQGHKGEPAGPNWVKGIRGVKKVALARNMSCALLVTGDVHCWGENYFIEADPNTRFMTPVRVPELSSIVDIAAADRHGCAVTSAGALYCWGNNDDGELGFGAAEVGKTFKKPKQVMGIADAVGVATSDTTTIAWTKSGDLYRWGTASDPSRNHADASPRKMAILSGVQRAEVESNQACALLGGGQVRCFSHETLQDFLAGNEHDFGPAMAALGSAIIGKDVAAIPNKFVFPDGRGLSGVINMAVFNNDASAVTDKGEVYSWGSGEWGTAGYPYRTKGFFPPNRIQGFTNAVAIVGSFIHRCGLEKSGEVRCFGGRAYLGSESSKDSTSAVVVKGLPKIVHIASNEECTFALAEDHSLWAWGNATGRTCAWTNDPEDSPLPIRVALAKTAP